MEGRTSGLGTRWTAVGVTVAVMLGAGGAALVGTAAGSADKPVTVLLDEPCRLRDTRPNKGIGGRTTPLGASEVYTVQGTGPSGECDVPGDALGLLTNVTAVLPTLPTDLRLYPTGADVPPTSNLNPAPGQPPTPNAVTVGLNGAGRFDILNKFGTVHVIIDVAGYLVDHHHDGRYVTETEFDRERPTGAYDGGNSSLVLTDSPKVVAEVTVDQATSGRVILSSSATVWGEFTQGNVECSITTGSSIDANYRQEVKPLGTGNKESIAGNRGYVINKGAFFSPDEDEYRLVCLDTLDNPTRVLDANLTAIFVPDPAVFTKLPPPGF